MDIVETMMKLLLALCGLVTAIILLINFFSSPEYYDITYKRLKSSVSAGEIVEKRTEEGRTDFFSGYVPVRYFFEVEWEYEKDGEVTVESKDFEVERDVYLAYDIGDYYDSQNFRLVSETENTEVEERDKEESTE